MAVKRKVTHPDGISFTSILYSYGGNAPEPKGRPAAIQAGDMHDALIETDEFYLVTEKFTNSPAVWAHDTKGVTFNPSDAGPTWCGKEGI